jgi:hypothetical protein
MDERIKSAIEALLDQLETQEKEVADLKRTINALCRRAGEPEKYAEAEPKPNQPVATRADQYFGKALSTAAQEVLERRKSLGACGADEILRGLEEGGFDFRQVGWRDGDRLRSLSITLSKNSKTFVRLPNGSFGLVAWYPEMKKAERTDRSGRLATEPETELTKDETAGE